jgi:hypothetical protein
LKFFKSKLEIPQFKVDQTTECVLRNLIALERCHYSEQPVICNYVFLIDSLINTKEDVEILVDKEIIVHELGSNVELAGNYDKWFVQECCGNIQLLWRNIKEFE